MKSFRPLCVSLIPLSPGRLGWLLAVVVSLGNGPALPGQDPRSLKPHVPVLTQAQKVRELTTQQANLGYTVRIRGVVTYVDDFALFLQDSSAGIAALAPGLSHTVHAGDLVDLDGIPERADSAPQINNSRH